jgi:hypothetical protein
VLLFREITREEITMDSTTIIRVVAGLFFIVLLFGAVLPPYGIIFKKAGVSPWLAILMMIPVVNIIILWVVAMSPWKTIPQPPMAPHPTTLPRHEKPTEDGMAHVSPLRHGKVKARGCPRSLAFGDRG